MTDKKLQLQFLRDFQDLEREIAGLEAEAEEIPKALQSIETEREAARAKQAGLEERRKDLDRERARREADIESERERMRKTQGKQIEIKTNKEYTALLQEIEGVKGAIDRLETEILEMMESAEEMIEDIRRGADRLREEEAQARSRQEGKKEGLRRIEDQLSNLRNDHQRIERDIDPDWLSEYQRIKPVRGWAVAALNGTICTGCHQSLILQLVHEIKHSDEIKTCPNCSRILYVPEIEESPAESPRPAEPTKA